MIHVEKLLSVFKKNHINFFSGVPDSVLKNLSIKIDKYSYKKHKIAVNEGSAVAMAIGYYLATKKLACVYMQNSGLGNAINPLASIAHHKVYSIPLLLLIGWRGSPSQQDEPQHMVKGKITKNLLNLLNIKYIILKKENDIKKIDKIVKVAKNKKKVVAILIENKILKIKDKIKEKNISKSKKINRDKFIEQLLRLVKKNSKIISTTGHTSRELMKIRKECNLNNGNDFYMVGGMGHSLSVSIGMSIQSNKQIICLDGDGSLLMHLGSMFTAGFNEKLNIKHILLNNNSHESVGGQTTNAEKIDFRKLSKSLGYKNYFKISNEKNLNINLKKFLDIKKSSFLEVIIQKKLDLKLPRPKNLLAIKKKFIS